MSNRTRNISSEIIIIDDLMSSPDLNLKRDLPSMTSALMRATLHLLNGGIKLMDTDEGKALEAICLEHKGVENSPFIDLGDVAFISHLIEMRVHSCGKGGSIIREVLCSARRIKSYAQSKSIIAELDPALLNGGDRFEHLGMMYVVMRSQVGVDDCLIITRCGASISIPRTESVIAFNPIELPHLHGGALEAIEEEVKNIHNACVSVIPEIIRKSPESAVSLLTMDTITQLMPEELEPSSQFVSDEHDVDPLAVMIHLQDKLNMSIVHALPPALLKRIGEDSTTIPHHPSIIGLGSLSEEALSALGVPIAKGFVAGIDLRMNVLIAQLNSKEHLSEESASRITTDLHMCLAARKAIREFLCYADDFVFPGGLASSRVCMDLMAVYMICVDVAGATCEAIKTLRKVSPLNHPVDVSRVRDAFLERWFNTVMRLNPGVSIIPAQRLHVMIFADKAVSIFMESGLVKPSNTGKATIETIDGEPSMMDNWDISTHNGKMKIYNPFFDSTVEVDVRTNTYTGVRSVFVLVNPLSRSWSRVGDVNAHGEVLLLDRLPRPLTPPDVNIIKVCLEGPRWILENSDLELEIEGKCIKTNDPLIKPQDMISGVITWMN